MKSTKILISVLVALLLGGCWSSELSRDEAQAVLAKLYNSEVLPSNVVSFKSSILVYNICPNGLKSEGEAVSYIANAKGTVDGKKLYSVQSNLMAQQLLRVVGIGSCDAQSSMIKISLALNPSLKNSELNCGDETCGIISGYDSFNSIEGITQASDANFERIVEFTTIKKQTELGKAVFGISDDQINLHSAKFRKYDDGWRLVSND